MLGPIKFIAFTEEVVELIAQQGVRYNLFAEDKQLYTAARSDKIMASQINIYSQLSISTIVNVAKALGRICNSYGGHEAWCWIGAKDVRFHCHKQRNNLIRIHIYA